MWTLSVYNAIFHQPAQSNSYHRLDTVPQIRFPSPLDKSLSVIFLSGSLFSMRKNVKWSKCKEMLNVRRALQCQASGWGYTTGSIQAPLGEQMLFSLHLNEMTCCKNYSWFFTILLHKCSTILSLMIHFQIHSYDKFSAILSLKLLNV